MELDPWSATSGKSARSMERGDGPSSAAVPARGAHPAAPAPDATRARSVAHPETAGAKSEARAQTQRPLGKITLQPTQRGGPAAPARCGLPTTVRAQYGISLAQELLRRALNRRRHNLPRF